MEKARLDKIIAGEGTYSRREVRLLVRQGRVLVDGVPARSPEDKVVPEAVEIMVDGTVLHCRRYTWIMLHKPAGVLSATEDGRGATVLDLLPPELRRRGLFPVGRLDKDTSGLLLLTDDGQLAHRLISPRHAVWKIYDAVHEGEAGEADCAAFRAGLTLRDGTVCRPAYLRPLGPGRSLVAVCEGKYHQVRRMLASRGMPVTALRRIAEGGLELGTLPMGMTRELTCGEIRLLETVDFDEAYLEKLVQKIRNML